MMRSNRRGRQELRGERSGRSSSRADRGSSRHGGRGYVYRPRSEGDVQRRQAFGGGERASWLDTSKVKKYEVKRDNCIRIFPPTWEDAEHFGLDAFVHYDVGSEKSSILCLEMMKRGKCAVCEERRRAEKAGDDEYAKTLRPAHRVLYYVLDRDNERDGLQVYDAPFTTIDKEITAQMVDKRSGSILNIDDPDNGYDVEFEKQGEGMKTKYTGVKIARDPSDIGRDQDEMLEDAVATPLPDLLLFLEEEEVEEMFRPVTSSDRSRGRRGGRDDVDDRGRGGRGRGRDEEEEEEDDDYTYEDVMEMGFDELEDIVDEERLDLDPRMFDTEDELAEAVCEELGLTPPRRGRR